MYGAAVSDRTSEDVKNGLGMPSIVMLATGRQATALVLPAPAELGRRIAAAGQVHDVADERMSRDHAVVSWDGESWHIRDLDSRNGTFVEGERISGEVRRRGDAILRLGHTLFMLLADGRGHPAPEGEHVVGPELGRAHERIRGFAREDVLLIHGEPGSGRELAARVYHQSGPRRAGPFVTVNCAAMPDAVAERLLFGAKKGVFAGAIEAIGHLQMANGGTLFLSEVAELGAAAQARLLHVIDTREVIPVGARSGTPLELGIAAGCHRELKDAVGEHRFSTALYERLSRRTVELPPLRARRMDLARLVQREIAAAPGGLAPHPKLVETCCLRPWPGNLAELRAAVRRAAVAAVAAERDQVRAEDLDPMAGMPAGAAAGETAVDRPIAGGEPDKAAVTAALARANGVVSVAARNLGLHRSQLQRLMVKHGIAFDDT